MLKKMPGAIDVTGRILCNSRIHEPAPERIPGQRGRTRVRGERLPTPTEMLDANGLRRVDLKLYENSEYRMRVAEQTGCLFNAPGRQVKVVAVEHLRGGRGREVFYSTVTDAKAEQILQWFSWRWTGAATNIAFALLLDPTIKDRIVVVWIGGHPYHFDSALDFNLKQDVVTAQVLFSSDAGSYSCW